MYRKLLIGIIIIALCILTIVNYRQRTELAKQLETQRSESSQQQTDEVKEILSKVGTHILLQGNVPPTVAKIVDVDTLRKKSAFYATAKNGDYLIVTTTRAILYDPVKDIVIDTLPIQLQQAGSSSSASSASRKK